MAKSNFYSYVAQLKVQTNSKNPAVAKDAVQVLALFDKVVMARSGKAATKMTVSELKEIPFDLNQKSPDHLKYWGSPSGNFLGIFGKKHRKKREKMFGGVGKALEKAGRGIGDAIKKVARLAASPLTLPLLPFKKAMRKQLDKKGIKYKNDLFSIVPVFYKHIVQTANYEGYEAYYIHVDSANVDGGASMSIPGVPDPAQLEGARDKVWDALGIKGENADKIKSAAKKGLAGLPEMIKAIISFFKKKKQKVEDGTATDEEKEMAADVAIGEQELQDPDRFAKAIREESIDKVQKSSMDTKSVVIYAIVGIVALKLMRVF